MNRHRYLLLCSILTCILDAGLNRCTCLAADSVIPSQAQGIPGYEGLYRDQEKLWVIIPEATRVIRIPAIAATLKSAHWVSSNTDLKIADQDNTERVVSNLDRTDSKQFKPDLRIEVDHWQLKLPRPDERTGTQSVILLTFETPVLLTGELTSDQASADGSFFLPAYRSIATGNTLRYEPQPHKNTLGYWTNPLDYAMWRINVPTPGKYNVAVLQGCGSGQGGSRAAVVIQRAGSADPAAAHEFDVLETGHFQNFQWIQLQAVHLPEPGEFELFIKPVKIAKAALMDIRAVHLVRLPD